MILEFYSRKLARHSISKETMRQPNSQSKVKTGKILQLRRVTMGFTD